MSGPNVSCDRKHKQLLKRRRLLAIGLKNSRHFLNQSEVKPKPIAIRLRAFSRAFLSASCIDVEFWLVHYIVCVLYDWSEYLLVVRHSIENFFRSYASVAVIPRESNDEKS